MPLKTEPNGSCFFFGQQMPLCGCGDPDSVLELIKKVLAAAREKKNLLDATGGDGALNWAFIYALDHAGLLEHGGTCSRSWLTSKGDAALDYLIDHGTESDAWNDETPVIWEESK